jgi:23S rRNA (uridine2552-2'-O)-methyltransferase
MKKYRDHYFEKAKRENYPARSVYKLKEIDKALRILRPGARILDLGASPGSWSLFAAEKVGPAGLVLAVDLTPARTDFPRNVTFVQDDAFAPGPELSRQLADASPFDAIISDMAPKTTGIKLTDQTRSLELCECAFELSKRHLRQGGHLLVKIFQGPDFKAFMDSLKPFFTTVKGFKPESSRAESKEMFLAALGAKYGPKKDEAEGEDAGGV